MIGLLGMGQRQKGDMVPRMGRVAEDPAWDLSQFRGFAVLSNKNIQYRTLKLKVPQFCLLVFILKMASFICSVFYAEWQPLFILPSCENSSSARLINCTSRTLESNFFHLYCQHPSSSKSIITFDLKYLDNLLICPPCLRLALLNSHFLNSSQHCLLKTRLLSEW